MKQGRKSSLILGLSAFALAAGLAISPIAMAAEDGGGEAPPKCKAGYSYDKTKKECVKKNALNDSDLYENGRALAKAGRYVEAIDALTAVRNQKDPMVLTMLGYSHRKMGDVDAGIALYHQALAIDPNSINTREYLGEGYVAMGRIDLAVGELNKLEKLCGVDCEQYVELSSVIAGRSEDW